MLIQDVISPPDIAKTRFVVLHLSQDTVRSRFHLSL